MGAGTPQRGKALYPIPHLLNQPNSPRCPSTIAGDFLLVDPIEEGEKVKAEINFVLYKDHVQYLKKEGLW